MVKGWNYMYGSTLLFWFISEKNYLHWLQVKSSDPHARVYDCEQNLSNTVKSTPPHRTYQICKDFKVRLCRRVNKKLMSFNAAINHVTEFSKDGCAFPGDIRSSEPELREQDIIIRTISLLFFIYCCTWQSFLLQNLPSYAMKNV